MSSGFSDNFIDELLSRCDIASLVGEYTQLTPKGGKLWACCPFHNEKTPSFKVDTSTGLYYCFGCHKGGNAITLLKEKENMSGFEAVKELARRVGMELPDSGYDKAEDERKKAVRQRLYNANRDAARFFFECLKKSNTALSYLRRRGLKDDIIARFGLGYAPDSWNALPEHLKSLGYSEDELIKAGLARRSEKGTLYSFFRNRVIFPIIDERGNVLAFGGRTMGNDDPKYLNTGDTPVYNKRRQVYALNMLKKGTLHDIIITEGYMDVISLHAAGVDNAVATLGTALTEAQARLLKRRTSIIYVSYDGDSAGQNATLRGLDILAREGLEVRVIRLPDGLDPDDYAKKYGKDGYMQLKDKSLSLNEFKLEHMAEGFNLRSAEGRQDFAVKACAFASRLMPVERDRFYDIISKKTGISYDTLREQGVRFKQDGEEYYPREKKQKPRFSDKAPSFAKTESERIDMLLSACAALDSEAADYIVKNGLELIKNASAKSFITLADRSYKEKGKFDIKAAFSYLEGDTSIIAAALMEQNIESPLAVAKDCIQRLRISELNAELMELSRKLDSREITLEEYRARYNELQEKLRRVRT